jgi:hypothetical protein
VQRPSTPESAIGRRLLLLPRVARPRPSTCAPLPTGPALPPTPTPPPAAARRHTDRIVPLGVRLRLGPPIGPPRGSAGISRVSGAPAPRVSNSPARPHAPGLLHLVLRARALIAAGRSSCAAPAWALAFPCLPVLVQCFLCLIRHRFRLDLLEDRSFPVIAVLLGSFLCFMSNLTPHVLTWGCCVQPHGTG